MACTRRDGVEALNSLPDFVVGHSEAISQRSSLAATHSWRGLQNFFSKRTDLRVTPRHLHGIYGWARIRGFSVPSGVGAWLRVRDRSPVPRRRSRHSVAVGHPKQGHRVEDLARQLYLNSLAPNVRDLILRPMIVLYRYIVFSTMLRLLDHEAKSGAMHQHPLRTLRAPTRASRRRTP